MTEPITRPSHDRHGRPVKVEVVSYQGGWWLARVWSGEVILRETRTHSVESEAKRQGERWLGKYLETGSWTEATAWHDANYWHTPDGSGDKPESSSHKGEGTPDTTLAPAPLPGQRTLFDALEEVGP